MSRVATISMEVLTVSIRVMIYENLCKRNTYTNPQKKKKQQNFINKQIKLQKFCPQLARLFEAGQLRAKYKK